MQRMLQQHNLNRALTKFARQRHNLLVAGKMATSSIQITTINCNNNNNAHTHTHTQTNWPTNNNSKSHNKQRSVTHLRRIMQMLQVALEMFAVVATNEITAYHLIECGNHKWCCQLSMQQTQVYMHAHTQIRYLCMVLSLCAQLLFTVTLLQQTNNNTKSACL